MSTLELKNKGRRMEVRTCASDHVFYSKRNFMTHSLVIKTHEDSFLTSGSEGNIH